MLTAVIFLEVVSIVAEHKYSYVTTSHFIVIHACFSISLVKYHHLEACLPGKPLAGIFRELFYEVVDREEDIPGCAALGFDQVLDNALFQGLISGAFPNGVGQRDKKILQWKIGNISPGFMRLGKAGACGFNTMRTQEHRPYPCVLSTWTMKLIRMRDFANIVYGSPKERSFPIYREGRTDLLKAVNYLGRYVMDEQEMRNKAGRSRKCIKDCLCLYRQRAKRQVFGLFVRIHDIPPSRSSERAPQLLGPTCSS